MEVYMENKELTSETQIDSYEEGISLKEIFTIIWRWKWIVIIITFVGFFLGGLAGYFTNKNQTSVTTIVEFQWDGVTKGEYPNGERFDYGSAFNATVYGQVIEDLSLEFSISELQKSLSITPIVPNNIIEVSEKALLQNIDFSYYPTSFRLSVNISKLGLNETQASSLLSALISEFRDDFERKYINRTIIFDFTQEDLSDYDYIESYEILKSQTSIIRNAASNLLPQASDFVSSELGIGFNDIIVRIDLLNSISLNNMESRINNYLLSKDSDLLITIYEYRVETLEYDLAEQQTIEVQLQTLVTNYEGGTSTIIIPGMDSNNEIATEPYLNTLYAKLVDTQGKIASYEQDIAFYELRIDRLNGDDPLFSITPQKQAEETQKVEDLITLSSNSISQIVEDTEILISEYNRFITKGLIRTIVPPQSESGASILLYGAIGLVLGGMIGLASAFLFDYRKNNLKK